MTLERPFVYACGISQSMQNLDIDVCFDTLMDHICVLQVLPETFHTNVVERNKRFRA